MYESAQVLVPGLFGWLASGGSLSPSPLLLLYGVSYFSHTLSVYSYNDYCDHRSDAANPRKVPGGSLARLGAQSILLTAIFLASAILLPLPVATIFGAVQALCMAYSHPGIRLKAKPLGSEVAHFVAGAGYFASGVLIGGGQIGAHLEGAFLFGLLYMSGGTFNEIMDYQFDRREGLRHLVVLTGPDRALRGVFAAHYLALVLLAATIPIVPILAICAAAAIAYTAMVLKVSRLPTTQETLLVFRSQYRLMFAAVLGAVLIAQLLERGGYA